MTMDLVPDVNARIAIVDDDASILKSLSRLLGTCSYCTDTYQSAHDFLTSLAFGTPACLIVDMQMPEMTGLELLQHLMRHGVRIPTIVITAYEEADTRTRCKAAGTRAYLLKPVQDEALIDAIEAALD